MGIFDFAQVIFNFSVIYIFIKIFFVINYYLSCRMFGDASKGGKPFFKIKKIVELLKVSVSPRMIYKNDIKDSDYFHVLFLHTIISAKSFLQN